MKQSDSQHTPKLINGEWVGCSCPACLEQVAHNHGYANYACYLASKSAINHAEGK